MKAYLLFAAAMTMVSGAALAQSLQMANVNDPGIYCRFSPDCKIAPMRTSSSFTPPNLAVTCVLESRSFIGSSMDSQGLYGYEYRLILNNDNESGTNFFAVKSLALNFNCPQSFAFGGHASNQVWIVADGGPGEVAPSAVNFMETNIVVRFDPPLVLATLTNRSIGTYFIGMASTNVPQLSTAIIEGLTQTPPNGPAPFHAEMQARTP
jgi:hypothetical protein